MGFIDIVTIILVAIGVIGLCFLISIPFVMLLFWWQEKKWKKNIPEEIKKEVEDAKDKRRREDDYREQGSDRVEESVEYLEPADTDVPRAAEDEQSGDIQIQPSPDTPEHRQEAPGDRAGNDRLKEFFK